MSTISGKSKIRPSFFKFRDINLAYYEISAKRKAKKDPVLFFHANGYTAMTYFPLFQNLTEAGYPVYALDFMGHGNSDSTYEFRDWYFFRDQILAFLDHLSFPSALGAGHSIGGASLLMAASGDSGGRLKKLAVLDPTVLTPFLSQFLHFYPNPLARLADKRRSVFKNLEIVKRSFRMMSGYKRWNEDSFDLYLKTAFRKREDGQFELCLSPDLEAKIFRSLKPGHWESYRKVKNPMLILSASKSDVTPPAACRKLLKFNRLSKSFKHDDGSHFFPMEDPQWSSSHMIHFFDNISN
ncbi:hypothetical protein CH373_05235 [Leptospira perolatii]|uniref:AB hydrolase-1 domain-containing protein n=1 Tax=Leptospira perolatii TaxID=2023191 RepID=A0A2M9ZQV6_9LEPT|nr:alpha/beta hydrolase [Leptospira perolatii]PJZ70477.1 hypothetical protein CH360_05655 [Leptospira perolatii]PJZ74313.1 hypothetical protein CH373_05235 [Leptospira perolatii]